MGIHLRRDHLIRLLVGARGSGGVLRHAVVETWPAGEELAQLFVFRLELGHVRRRAHVCGTWRRFLRLVHVGSGCEVGEVGLHATQALDVFFRGHGFVHVEGAQLQLVLWVHGAAAALGLQAVDLLE